MCWPIVGVIASLAGTAASAAGSLSAGQAAKAQADAQAKAYQQQADQEVMKGQYEGARKTEEGNQLMGRQTALAAGSGVDTTGSPTDVVASTASSVALDRSAIEYGARVNANNLNYEAALSKMQGQNAVTGSYFNAAGSIFGGLGQIAKIGAQDKTFMGNNFGPGY